jgi:6-phosphogluconolactonase
MNWRAYDSRAKLADALAIGVATVLAGGIATRGEATLAVSGGATPALFFERLSAADLDWGQVTVLPVDERRVPIDHPRSNYGLIQRALCRNAAGSARIVALNPNRNAAAELAAIEATISLMGQFDAVVLGMGTDGHTASLFPGGDRLAAALDPANPRSLEPIVAPGVGEPRITMTLRRLLDARLLALHIEGQAKRETFERAKAGGPPEEMPIRAVLQAVGDRLQVFWAP